MRKKMELIILLTATAGFFGFVYPELCLLDSTIIVVEEGDEDNKLQTEGVQNAEDIQQVGGAQEFEAEFKSESKITVEPKLGAESKTTAEPKLGAESKTTADPKSGTNAQHSEGADLLEQVSGLPPEKVRIKSRLFEYFSEIGRKD